MKHVLMAGSFGQGNIGDDAILGAMVNQLRTLLPDLRIQAVGGDTKLLQERFSIETVDWGDWAEIASIVRKTDLVIAGGGGIFFDYHGFTPRSLLQKYAPDLSHYATFPMLAGLFTKPLMLYGVGVGPLVSKDARDVVRMAFELADVATVRDRDSLRRLEEIGVQRPDPVEVTADAAFSLSVAPEESARATLAANGCDPSRPIIAIVPKPWPAFYPAIDWYSAVASALTGLMEAQSAQVMLMSFQPSEDDQVVTTLRRHLPDNDVFSIQSGGTPSEVAAMIGCCDLVVGMRLHALVLGVLTGTPGIAITCEPKVRAFMAELGRPDLCVEASDLRPFGATLTDAWVKRRDLRLEVSRKRDVLCEGALRNAKLAAALIERPPAPRTPAPALLNVLAQMIEGRLKEERALDAQAAKRISNYAHV